MPTSQNTKKCNETIFYNRSYGSLLEVRRLQTTYMPVNKPNKQRTLLYLPKVAMSKSTSNIKVLQSTKHLPAEELINTAKSKNQITISPRKPVDIILQENSNISNNGTKKVYLSEGQSKLVGGIPGAPPVTPFPGKIDVSDLLLLPLLSALLFPPFHPVPSPVLSTSLLSSFLLST